ncbi:unnamed protein product [Hermetia illucens]|uniref:Uncharacterized protein n=1 Tax=Hermetia illucens TaxID=343691 RepID=A0A7R8UR27_HERIL|nr:unnamed protein product [Hermetia illucens]
MWTLRLSILGKSLRQTQGTFPKEQNARSGLVFSCIGFEIFTVFELQPAYCEKLVSRAFSKYNGNFHLEVILSTYFGFRSEGRENSVKDLICCVSQRKGI